MECKMRMDWLPPFVLFVFREKGLSLFLLMWMYILNLIRRLLFVDSRVGRDGFQVDGGHGDEGSAALGSAALDFCCA